MPPRAGTDAFQRGGRKHFRGARADPTVTSRAPSLERSSGAADQAPDSPISPQSSSRSNQPFTESGPTVGAERQNSDVVGDSGAHRIRG